MIGISSELLDAIEEITDGLFDRMALRLLGNIPKLQGKKLAIFSTQEHYNLPSLFVQSLNIRPSSKEEEVLKNLLENANHYVDALKARTKAKLFEDLAAMGANSVDPDKLKKIISENFAKSGRHFQMIAETEATKVRNMGKVLTITKVASDMGVEDPLVFFILIRDAATCEDCIDNHTVDGTTPKVIKLSDVKVTYLSKEERKEGKCSVSGQHPSCRCTMAYLPGGFGFNKNGSMTYISMNHNEYNHQRGIKE